MDNKGPHPLTDKEVEQSAGQYGRNYLTRQKQKSFLSAFFGNLNDPVIRILLGALIVNIIFAFRSGDWIETAGIGIAVFLATFISTLSERTSQRAFEKLDSEADKTVCRVRRAGGIRELPIYDLVVGDIIILTSGEFIPADCRLIKGRLTVDQSAMTGESVEAEKHRNISTARDPSNPSALFRGCAVLSGECEAVVTAVGDRSFLGEISKEIQQRTRESPLRVRLTKLAGQIGKFGYVIAAMVGVAYLFNAFCVDSSFDKVLILNKLSDISFVFGTLLEAFTLSLTVIVMAVPEGLPMMIAVVLSSNLRRMMKDNVLVRKPVGIEAAGSMNILFTDKTGTLTEGQSKVGKLMIGNGDEVTVRELKNYSDAITEYYRLSSFYNTASTVTGNKKAAGGNSTDRELLASVIPFGEPRGYRVVGKEVFDSEKKQSSARLAGKENIRLIKGAPERLLPKTDKYISKNGTVLPLMRSEFSALINKMTSNGGRVILLAYSDIKSEMLTLICAVEMTDHIRASAAPSVSDLQSAGIRVVMITGDNRETAGKIAVNCGIIRKSTDIILTSDEMSKISDSRLLEMLPDLSVVARALPADKSRLVRVAEEAGMVVGMTGDGVNDAPALRRADVGFAMGSGTQVAKEAGDIVILDNDLASIVKAVLYGRTVFKSIRKFITLQLTMNICACGVTMIGPFIGISAPVTVLQMLWINMVMDTLGGLAFAGEPPRRRYLNEKPKRRDEPILNGYMINELILNGGFTLALSIAFLSVSAVFNRFGGGKGSICHLTAFFAFFIISSVLNCFNSRTDRLNLFADLSQNRIFLLIMMFVTAIQLGFVYFGGEVLRTVPLTPAELGLTLLLSLSVIPADFIRKLLRRLFGKREGY